MAWLKSVSPTQLRHNLALFSRVYSHSSLHCLDLCQEQPEASTDSDSAGPAPVAGESLAETSAGKIAKALELKEEGNAAFKAGDYKRAIKKYHHVLMYTKAVTSPSDLQSMIPGLPELSVKKFHATEEEKAVATELAVTISNNLAGTQLFQRTVVCFAVSLYFCCDHFSLSVFPQN